MKLDDDFDFEYDYDFEEEEQVPRRLPQNSSVLATAFIMVSVFILLVLLLVLSNNQSKSPMVSSNSVNSLQPSFGTVSEAEAMHSNQMQVEQSVDELISGSNLRAEDLTIWEDSYEMSEGAEDASQEEEAAEEETQGEDTEENRTEIIHEDGTSEWIDINPYLDLHGYNFANLVYQAPFMKYYENNTRVSYVGVDISKEQDYVDFNELKRNGVDFVMIRLGQRGYETGELSLDEYFADNMKRASEAGLDIGVYFFSQAITLEEAQEEAEFVVEALEGYELQYPVVFRMEELPGLDCRIESLEKMQRTNIAIQFIEIIEENGFMSMIYGDKEWLLQDLSIGSLIGVDVWYAEEGDLPDYPYEFTMWQYTTSGSVPGIAGNANLNICFIDYSIK